jgi:pSer/pThr/pTyr-binding forkhead associated (FHA) protein
LPSRAKSSLLGARTSGKSAENNLIMVKLVVLSAELSGRACELKLDKTTIGRVDGNAFQIPHASISSHHCEVLLHGEEVIVRDLNSKNGTFINNRQITAEEALKVGQILRLGQVELRLEQGGVPHSSSRTEHSSITTSEEKPKKSNTPLIIVGVVVAVIIVAALVWFLKGHSGR